MAEINGLDAELDPQQYLVLLNQLHVSQVRHSDLSARLMALGVAAVTSLFPPGSAAGSH